MNALALKRKACKNENQPIALMTDRRIQYPAHYQLQHGSHYH